MTKEEILSRVDHTLLKQGSTWQQIKVILDEAMEAHTASACIPPYFVKKPRNMWATDFQSVQLLVFLMAI